jgi:hypothetical protein
VFGAVVCVGVLEALPAAAMGAVPAAGVAIGLPVPVLPPPQAADQATHKVSGTDQMMNRCMFSSGLFALVRRAHACDLTAEAELKL